MDIFLTIAAAYLLGAVIFYGVRYNKAFEPRGWFQLRATAPELSDRASRRWAIAVLITVAALWPFMFVLHILDFFFDFSAFGGRDRHVKLALGSTVRVEGSNMHVLSVRSRGRSAIVTCAVLDPGPDGEIDYQAMERLFTAVDCGRCALTIPAGTRRHAHPGYELAGPRRNQLVPAEGKPALILCNYCDSRAHLATAERTES